MFLIILGILDIVGGFCILGSEVIPRDILFYVGIAILIKGIISIAGSFAGKHWLDWMGAIDIIAGSLLVSGFNIPWLWLLPIMKGLYSIITGLAR